MPFPIPEPEMINAAAARLVDDAMEALTAKVEDGILLDAALARLLAASTDAATFSFTQDQIAKIVAARLHSNRNSQQKLQ